MKKELLDKVETFLQQAKEFYMPAADIWGSFDGLECRKSQTFESFIELIKDDPRFYLIDSSQGKQNFGLGPLVGLQKRKPSKEQIKELLIKKTDNIISALQEAYKARPDDSRSEGDLLDVMIKAKKIKENIDKAFSDENG